VLLFKEETNENNISYRVDYVVYGSTRRLHHPDIYGWW